MVNQFDEYRKEYSTLDFQGIKKWNDRWQVEFPDQHHFDINFYNRCFSIVASGNVNEDPENCGVQYYKPTSVVELGGNDGSLAKAMIDRTENHIDTWLNFEISNWKQVEQTPLKEYVYQFRLLNTQLWNAGLFLEDFDVFLASDVLEHFTSEEFIKIMDYVNKEEFKYLMLRIPIGDEPTINWDGYFGSHLCNLNRQQIKDLLSVNYKLILDEGAWNTLWKHKDLM